MGREQHPDEKTILVCPLGLGVVLYLQGFTGKLLLPEDCEGRQEIPSYFNLNFILRADSAQRAAVIHNTGKRFP